MPAVTFQDSPKDTKMRVQFHVMKVEGLSQAINKHASKDLAAFVSAEGPDIHPDVYDCETDIVRNKKEPLTWNENLQIMDLDPTSSVIFCVKHRPRTAMGLLKSKSIVTLGKTDAHPVSELFRLQGGHDLKSKLVLPLYNDSKSSAPAFLTINVREILQLNSPRFRESLDKDNAIARRKTIVQQELKEQGVKLSRQLQFIETTSPSTALNDLLNIAIGVTAALQKVCYGRQEQHKDVMDALTMINEVHMFTIDCAKKEETSLLMKQPLITIIQGLFLVISFIQGIKPSITRKNLWEYTKSLELCKQDLYKKEYMSKIIIDDDIKTQRAILRDIILGRYPRLKELNPVSTDMPKPTGGLTPDNMKTIHLISEWVVSPSNPGQAKIFWLYGPAGCGKSQFASHLTQSFDALKYLATYFSFNHVHGSKNTLGMLAGTLAYQLAIARPELASYISKAIEENPSIKEVDLQSQFKKLIIEPMVIFERENEDKIQEPLVIVLDELDQCGLSGLEGLEELLALLTNGLHGLPAFVHVLALSWPILGISEAFSNTNHIVKHLYKGISTETEIQWIHYPLSNLTMTGITTRDPSARNQGRTEKVADSSTMFKWILSAHDITEKPLSPVPNLTQCRKKSRSKAVRASVSSKHRSDLSTIKETLSSEECSETEE